MEHRNTRRVIAAGAIGNVLEWYDFAVYGYFAAAIGRAFFPGEDPVAQVLAAKAAPTPSATGTFMPGEAAFRSRQAPAKNGRAL